MDNTELQDIWKSYDQKVGDALTINKKVAIMLTKQKLNHQIGQLYLPKWMAIGIGIPYVVILIIITVTATFAGAFLVALGFGTIALINTALIASYIYHISLVRNIRCNDDILSTQHQLSRLRISSYNTIRMAVLQLPFWSICWMSMNALEENPLLYGGVHLLICLVLSYLSYWLYGQLEHQNTSSKIRDFFLTGQEWNPILKSERILEQIHELKE